MQHVQLQLLHLYVSSLSQLPSYTCNKTVESSCECPYSEILGESPLVTSMTNSVICAVLVL